MTMAPRTSSWAGRARIKGYGKLQRMAMLTFSLAGLQYVILFFHPGTYVLFRLHPPCLFFFFMLVLGWLD